MLKVFIVDDESIIREGLRDNIPWQQYGYEFVGEASDGEMALPMIRKLQPDVLITDIKMPFMDGLALSRIVSRDFPDIKIIIVSGYDEFEYAREAINVGVEQYLLKPVTRNNLQKILSEIRSKIEAEQEQKTYLEKFQNDMLEFEQYSRRNFMEKVFEGQLSTEQIYSEADKLSMNLNGSSYNLILLNYIEKKEGEQQRIEEELLRYFLRFPEYMVFRWSINTYMFIIKGDLDTIKELNTRCVDNIVKICGDNIENAEWYIAVGNEVSRLSQLSDCYTKVNSLLAHRFLNPSQKVFTGDSVDEFVRDGDSRNLSKVDSSKVSPEIIKSFLNEGEVEEIDEFVSGYLAGFKEALGQKMFRNYLLLNFRFTVAACMESMNLNNDNAEEFDDANLNESVESISEMESYLKELLRKAMELRNNETADQSKHVLKKALEYIDENFCEDSLSLNSVSSVVGVSSNYFSGIFSQEMEQTFIEYVTTKRMDRAKKLLKETELHSGEIAAKVGYKDSHYFSFVFKKTQGCTPREYRNGR